MKVVYWPRIALAKAETIARLNEVPGAELTVAETLPALLEALPGAQALVLADAPPAEAGQVVEALQSARNTVRWMHFLTAGREGFEAVGLPEGIAVTWAAGGVSATVAEHAMALLLALVRRVPEMVVQTARAQWDRGFAARASSLEGATMVIAGYGHIGHELAKRARAFGMRVEAVTRTPRADEALDAVHPMSALHEVLARADAIVVAAALSAETRHLFDARAFARCKPGALLVNVARGGLVDQAALREALVAGRLGGAGLDVTDPEPLPATDPLWSAPNLLVSPHFAGGASAASLQRLAQGAADNLRRLIAGEPLQHRVH